MTKRKGSQKLRQRDASIKIVQRSKGTKVFAIHDPYHKWHRLLQKAIVHNDNVLYEDEKTPHALIRLLMKNVNLCIAAINNRRFSDNPKRWPGEQLPDEEE